VGTEAVGHVAVMTQSFLKLKVTERDGSWPIPWKKKTRQFTVGNAKIQNRHGLFHGNNSPVYCRGCENTKPPWPIPPKQLASLL